MDIIFGQEKQRSGLKRIDAWVENSILSGALPKRPDLMLRLLEMTASVDTLSLDVVSTLAQDPELSANIIRQARLKLDSRVNQITNKQLQQSIPRLGYDFVQTAIEVNCFKRFLKCLRPSANQDLINELRHSLRAAFIAKRLSRLSGFTQYNYAFFAGLMHNMGKIIIGLQDPRIFQEISNMSQRGLDEKSAELILMGFEHNEISAKLVESWALPDIISKVIRCFEHPALLQEEEEKKLADILRLSKYIAKALNDKEKSPRSLMPRIREHLLSLADNFSDEDLQEEITDLYIKTLSMEDRVFSLD